MATPSGSFYTQSTHHQGQPKHFPSSDPGPKKVTLITPEKADEIGHQRFVRKIREIGTRIVEAGKKIG